jgi:hypothetical protein
MDLLGEASPDFGEHVIAELDQVERIHGHLCAREPHPQGLPERR